MSHITDKEYVVKLRRPKQRVVQYGHTDSSETRRNYFRGSLSRNRYQSVFTENEETKEPLLTRLSHKL